MIIVRNNILLFSTNSSSGISNKTKPTTPLSSSIGKDTLILSILFTVYDWFWYKSWTTLVVVKDVLLYRILLLKSDMSALIFRSLSRLSNVVSSTLGKSSLTIFTIVDV